MKRLIIVVALAALAGAAYFTLAGLPIWVRWEVKKAVSAELVDPDSAIFKNLRYERFKIAACGEVNSRNKFGGYAGYRKFYYSLERGSVIFSSDDFDVSTLGC